MNILNAYLASANNPMQPRDLSVIRYAIVHHTAGNPNQTVSDIDAEHRNKGWAMIGYNRVIVKNGDVYQARPDNVVPAAAYGLNLPSINIALTGNFQEDDAGYTGPPTDAQYESLLNLLVDVHQMYPQIDLTIGHRDVAGIRIRADGISAEEASALYGTACPGSYLYSRLIQLKTAVAARLRVCD